MTPALRNAAWSTLGAPPLSRGVIPTFPGSARRRELAQASAPIERTATPPRVAPGDSFPEAP